jgi:hypothetical protein
MPLRRPPAGPLVGGDDPDGLSRKRSRCLMPLRGLADLRSEGVLIVDDWLPPVADRVGRSGSTIHRT